LLAFAPILLIDIALITIEVIKCQSSISVLSFSWIQLRTIVLLTNFCGFKFIVDNDWCYWCWLQLTVIVLCCDTISNVFIFGSFLNF